MRQTTETSKNRSLHQALSESLSVDIADKVIEYLKDQRVSTTQEALSAVLGEKLTELYRLNTQVTINFSTVEDDQSLAGFHLPNRSTSRVQKQDESLPGFSLVEDEDDDWPGFDDYDMSEAPGLSDDLLRDFFQNNPEHPKKKSLWSRFIEHCKG